MLRARRISLFAGVLVALAVGSAGPASATGDAPNAERPDGADGTSVSRPITATYHGRPIDLSAGWGTAHVCAEVELDHYQCFDNDAEAAAALGTPAPPKARSSAAAATIAGETVCEQVGCYTPCPNQWVCLFEDSFYNQFDPETMYLNVDPSSASAPRKLQWTNNGQKDLGPLNFRDQASSFWDAKSLTGNLTDITLTDFRSLQFDEQLYFNHLRYDHAPEQLSRYSHPQGNWNDKTDRITIG